MWKNKKNIFILKNLKQKKIINKIQRLTKTFNKFLNKSLNNNSNNKFH